MKKRILALLLCVCLTATALTSAALAWSSDEEDLYEIFGDENGLTTEQLENMEEIYDYLKDDMALNTAAACGILANMYRESRFDPEASNSSDTSLGLVQWYGSNRTSEIDWCEENGYDPYSLDGQLNYLYYQFQTNYSYVYAYLLEVEDSAEGAYDAGWYFCDEFERPSDSSASVGRGNLAEEVFYPFYLQLQDAAEEDTLLPFEDVEPTDWFYSSVLQAYQMEIISGTSETTFEPDEDMSRAAAVQILYNMNGNPEPTASSPFTDVDEDAWYKDAVDWAWSTGCIDGVSSTSFNPSGILDRQQMAQMIYNYYVNYQGYEATNLADLDSYLGADEITYGETAMRWAIGNGIIYGQENGGECDLNPLGSCTRAQGCTMLVRFITVFE